MFIQPYISMDDIATQLSADYITVTVLEDKNFNKYFNIHNDISKKIEITATGSTAFILGLTETITLEPNTGYPCSIKNLAHVQYLKLHCDFID